MGIKEGAWVGLMLGNVPDFVILALALSKLDAAIVPIDPTTGGRELELILAAAPLRALVTRPRGSEGSISANGTSAPVPPSTLPRSRVAAARPQPPPGHAAPPAPAADAAEVRRRLQGTLLTCSRLQAQPARSRRRSDRGAVHRRFARRSEGRAAHRQEHDRRRRSRDRRARHDRQDEGPRRGAAVPRVRLGPRLSADAQARLHDVPRRGDLGAPDRQARPRARGRRPARHAVDVRRAVEAADREEARAREAELPRRRLAPRSGGRRRVLQRVRRAHPQLLPLDGGRDGRARGHRQVSRRRSASRSTASRSRSPRPTASRAAQARTA